MIDDAKGWCVVKEGYQIKAGTPRVNSLSLALRCHTDDEETAQSLMCISNECNEAAEADGRGTVKQQPLAPGMVECPATATVRLAMPGGSDTSCLFVPPHVSEELLAAGMLEMGETGYLHWNPIIPVELQQTQLIEVMPEGIQRHSLARKFNIAAPNVVPRIAPSTASPSSAPPRVPPQHGTTALALTSDARKWTDTKTADRNNCQRGSYRWWPWATDKTTDTTDFLENLFSKVSNIGSRAAYKGGLEMWLSLFETGGATLESIFEQLAANKRLMPEVFSLKIVGPELPWTSKMLTSCKLTAQFIRSRASTDENDALANKMSLLLDDFIEHRLEACSQAKSVQLVERDEDDFDWLSMMNADASREAVVEMMASLATAAHAIAAGKRGPWKQIATTSMTGIMFLAQCNSRPGPWKYLTTDTIDHMKAKSKDYWTAIKGHKQAGIRGAHGAYMSPGCVKAAEIYMAIAGRRDNGFWLYTYPKIDAWLKEACAVFLPGYPLMSPTAMRQHWETVMYHDSGELAEKIANAKESMNNAMDHEEACGDKHYAKGKARKVAYDSKVCTIGYYDGLIDWPPLTGEFLDGNADAVREKFAALAEVIKAKAKARAKDATAANGYDDEAAREDVEGEGGDGDGGEPSAEESNEDNYESDPAEQISKADFIRIMEQDIFGDSSLPKTRAARSRNDVDAKQRHEPEEHDHGARDKKEKKLKTKHIDCDDARCKKDNNEKKDKNNKKDKKHKKDKADETNKEESDESEEIDEEEEDEEEDGEGEEGEEEDDEEEEEEEQEEEEEDEEADEDGGVATAQSECDAEYNAAVDAILVDLHQVRGASATVAESAPSHLANKTVTLASFDYSNQSWRVVCGDADALVHMSNITVIATSESIDIGGAASPAYGMDSLEHGLANGQSSRPASERQGPLSLLKRRRIENSWASTPAEGTASGRARSPSI
jgi:hypothetical protein